MNLFIKSHFRFLCAGGLVLAAYGPTWVWMWDRWFARDSYYSHGVLIPFVVLFLIWQKKEDLARVPKARSGWGMVLIGTGFLAHILASLMRVYFVSGFSMLVVLIGLIMFFYGVAVVRVISFPLFFLIFLVPVPLVVITNISFKMKILAAKIATAVLNDSGIAALREGSVIRMRHAQVVVDDVCSGLRSLISLMALGSIFAYWMKSTLVRKWILFALTIPIAIVTNVVRIIFLSSVAEIWGPQFAAGFLHDVSGFLVFALAFVLLYMFGKVLEK